MTVGYIVETIRGSVMEVGNGDDIKYFGNKVTVFDSRRKAKRSIDATIKDRPSFESDFGKLGIVRCESARSK